MNGWMLALLSASVNPNSNNQMRETAAFSPLLVVVWFMGCFDCHFTAMELHTGHTDWIHTGYTHWIHLEHGTRYDRRLHLPKIIGC